MDDQQCVINYLTRYNYYFQVFMVVYIASVSVC